MGHAIDYITVNNKKDILPAAEEFAYWNVDEGENPSRSYHGNLRVHDDYVADNYEEAEERINRLDRGWYDDHAVKYKDKNGKIKWLVKVEVHC